MKPIPDWLAPGAMEPFQLAAERVTTSPFWDAVEFQDWLSCWLPAKAQVRVQLLTGVRPVLVMVTAPVKPLAQSF